MALSGIDSLADEIFGEKPARLQREAYDSTSGAHRYLQSRVFSGSRGLHPDEQAPPQRLSQTAIVDKILHTERLGPYERQLLASILRTPHSMVILSGSTGSGKTSTLRHVLEFYDANARLSSVAVETGFIPRHVYVDFNKLFQEYTNAEHAQPGAGLDILYEKIPLRIYSAILRSVRDIARHRKVPPAQVVIDLIREAFSWATCEQDVPGDLKYEWEDLLCVPMPNVDGNPDQNIQEVLLNLQEQAKQRKRSNIPLMFWCAVYDALAIKALPTGKSALLLLDNIDPLPDEVQRSLRDEFIALCQDARFKVILPLRHSRVGIHKRVPVTGAYSWYPHCGPNPIEVIHCRLLGFIGRPESYPAFRDLVPEWQEKALHRALELLLRLMRGTHHYRAFGQLAIAGAGDSVRRALDPIRALFQSSDPTFELVDDKARGAITTLALELQALSCSGSIGLALREEIVGIAMEHDAQEPNGEKIRAWSERLTTVVRAVLRDSFDHPDVWFQSRVDKLWANLDLQKLVLEDIETAAALLQERVSAKSQERIITARHGDYASSVREDLAAGLLEGLRSLCPDANPPRGFTAFAEILCDGLRGLTCQPEAGAEGSEDLLFSWDKLRICANMLSRNRSHAMTRALMRNGHLHNLLVDRHGKSSLTPLTLLYYLALQEQGEVALKTVIKLIRLEHTEQETLALINRLCSVNNRVIWINQEFSHVDYSELRKLSDDGARVTLTQGGWAYYLSILNEIDYLMQCLLTQDSEVQLTEFLASRLEAVVLGLRDLLQLRSAHRSSVDPLWRTIERCLIADLVIRTSRGFTRAVSGHFSKMQRNLAISQRTRTLECTKTRRVALDWMALLQDARRSGRVDDFVNIPLPPSGNTSLLPYARVGSRQKIHPATCVARWDEATSTLETLLRGSELWAPHLPSDSYHLPVDMESPPMNPGPNDATSLTSDRLQ